MAVAEEIRVVRFRCSLCHKSWSSRKSAARHAAECIHDPDTRACATCRHDERGHPSSYEEPGLAPSCDLGARPADERVVRHCPLWARA